MVLNQIDQYIDEFPRLASYFVYHKAQVYDKQKEYEKALLTYKGIKANNHPTFILFKIGLIYYRMDKFDTALKYLCKAAASKNKSENKLKVFLVLAELFEKKQELKYAYFHYDLYIHIKQKNNWKIPKKVLNNQLSIYNDIELGDYKSNHKNALYECKKIWSKYNTMPVIRDKIFKGKISLNPNKPYEFINTLEGESYFVSQNNLSSDITNGCIVWFKITPKFDKKKNKESWEAINVQKKGAK